MNFDPTKTLAIVIGVENYDEKDILHALPAASANAVGMYNVLKNKIGIPPSNIYREIDPKKASDLLEEIAQKTDPEFEWELIIFYYAGHGLKSDDQKQYFLSTRSSKPSRPAISAINIQQLISEYLNTTKLLLILDSCFSGKAFDFAAGRYDYYIMASSSYRESTKYPLNEEYSAFTKALIDTIERGIKTKNTNAWLNIEDIFEETKLKLTTLRFNMPIRLSKGELGSLDFVKNSRAESSADASAENEAEADTELNYTEFLYRRLRKHNKQVVAERQSLDVRSPSFQSELTKLVLECYPYPIAYFLKNILADHAEAGDAGFYKHLFKHAVYFLSFSMIVDLLSNHKQDDIEKLLAFDIKEITPDAALSILIDGCSKFSGKLFISELKETADFLQSALKLKQLLNVQAPVTELKEATLIFLGDLGFLCNYQLLAIRNIIVNKGYCPPITFRHETSVLMGETLSNYKRNLVFDGTYLHNGTVILIKKNKVNEGGQYLNLWPLVVDANGFNEGSDKPDIHFFSDILPDSEFTYTPILLSNSKLTAKAYTDINDIISDEDKEKYFDAFMKDFKLFF